MQDVLGSMFGIVTLLIGVEVPVYYNPQNPADAVLSDRS